MGHVGVEVVAYVARENVEVVVEGVLAASGLVVLDCGDALTLVCFAHGAGDCAGDRENMSAHIVGKIINILMVVVWHDDHVAGIVFDPKRIDKSGAGFVFVDYILW